MRDAADSRVAHGPWVVVAGGDDAAVDGTLADRAGQGVWVAGRSVLAVYRWRWWPADAATPRAEVHAGADGLRVVEAEAGGLRLERELGGHGQDLHDRLVVANEGRERRALTLELAIAAPADAAAPVLDAAAAAWTLPGAPPARLRLDALAAAHPDGADWELSLAPGERVEVGAVFELVDADATAAV